MDKGPRHTTAIYRPRRLMTFVCSGVVVAMCVATACTRAPESPTDTGSERARWEAAKIPNYTWTLKLVTSWGGDVSETTVVGGKPVKFLDNGKEASIQEDEDNGIIPLTVDELFDAMDDAYRSGKEVTVAYDPTYG